MAQTGVTVAIMTIVWAFVGIVLPILTGVFMAKSPNKGIIQICLILTAVCCYLLKIKGSSSGLATNLLVPLVNDLCCPVKSLGWTRFGSRSDSYDPAGMDVEHSLCNYDVKLIGTIKIEL